MKKRSIIESYLINVIDVASYERKREASNFDLRYIAKNLPTKSRKVLGQLIGSFTVHAWRKIPTTQIYLSV